MFTLNCKGRLLTIDSPIVMGIINVNEDSFFRGSRHLENKDVLATVERMLSDGASILDIGGQSTRPGSPQISEDEELRRVVPAIELIRKDFPQTFISVDTYYSNVAKAAVEVGADIINDISAGSIDENLLKTVAVLSVPYILMHMQGRQTTMQQSPAYDNVTRDVLDFLIQKKALLQSMGIKDIIVDPGYGFGKTIRHNFTLLKNQKVFEMLDCPILTGISRKSTIYKTLDTDADHALNGTTVLNTIALLNGASILRVHDVKEAAEAVKLVGQL